MELEGFEVSLSGEARWEMDMAARNQAVTDQDVQWRQEDGGWVEA